MSVHRLLFTKIIEFLISPVSLLLNLFFFSTFFFCRHWTDPSILRPQIAHLVFSYSEKLLQYQRTLKNHYCNHNNNISTKGKKRHVSQACVEQHTEHHLNIIIKACVCRINRVTSTKCGKWNISVQVELKRELTNEVNKPKWAISVGNVLLLDVKFIATQTWISDWYFSAHRQLIPLNPKHDTCLLLICSCFFLQTQRISISLFQFSYDSHCYRHFFSELIENIYRRTTRSRTTHLLALE